MYPTYIESDLTAAERKRIFKQWRAAGVMPKHVEYRPSPDGDWSMSRAYASNGDHPFPCQFGEYRVSGVIGTNNLLDETLKEMEAADAINPDHYTSHPSGVECIKIIRHMPTCIAMAVKYLWRLDDKYDGTKDIEDLRKAIRWLEEEIDKRETT